MVRHHIVTTVVAHHQGREYLQDQIWIADLRQTLTVDLLHQILTADLLQQRGIPSYRSIHMPTLTNVFLRMVAVKGEIIEETT